MGRLLELNMESDALELARNFCRDNDLMLLSNNIEDDSLIVMDRSCNTKRIYIKNDEWSLTK
ncbi:MULTISPECIES: hypothetical protein [Paraclostridium]|jgi:hypothetical protein|uniref:Uncharacterized protein n=1 Tax=Paraclostridium bifermentans ATCC 638 = DSM 14991 TaxID=1233171 RepID=T4VI51_PARBF|nr:MULTISPECIES: hypothetical protein [Paraclostridium]KGJ48916.1 hypothetical protein KD33_12195 [Clostridium sp. NCR]EQK43399.1 hypothetical protein C672_2343 [[Clostridium] bifermentans ATCC 638] [Paraclostridium bifermentans ATCC 638 = DSM 14991]MBS5954079.1 hypothetical protein [Paraclostridium bifermentans]MBS6508854.1 hypothetical protein [Paraclostridium bifermentans]MBU5287211.1 hypothetical protein [Paraclostridium bifermentans]